VRQLPSEYYAVDGTTLTTRLKQRRDRLQDSAGRFYELLAHKLEIYGTDQADVAQIDRSERDDSIEVRLTHAGDAGRTTAGACFRPTDESVYLRAATICHHARNAARAASSCGSSAALVTTCSTTRAAGSGSTMGKQPGRRRTRHAVRPPCL
jgi:hypothetical protein